MTKNKPIEIKFTIHGTPDDPKGSPIPKLRKTRHQQWTPEAKRYVRWKEHVQIALIDAISKYNPAAARDCARNLSGFGKPLVLGDLMAHMAIRISWKNKAHGDPENIFGSIADALFHNDKNLYGSFLPNGDTPEPSGSGKVDVTITVSPNQD